MSHNKLVRSAFYTDFGMGTKYLRSRFAFERFFGTGEVFDK